MLKRLYMILIFTGLTSCKKEEPAIEIVKDSSWIVYNTGNSPLIHNQVQAIAIDNNNTKWFGTVNGLTRFDDHNWTSYDTLNSLLPSSFITSLGADDKGNVWIGTDAGLVKYDGVNFIRCEKLNKEFINRILIDNLRNIVWIGTDKGLCKYDGSHWERYDDPGSSLMEGFVSSLAIDNRGILWMSSFDHYSFTGRLFRFDGINWQSNRMDQRGLNSCFPDALVIDSDNVLWLGVKGTMGGMLVRIEGNEWKIVDSLSTGFDNLQAGVNAIVSDGQQKWISSGNGLLIFNGTAWRMYTTTNSGIPDNYIFGVALDKDGNKWIGTLSGGVAMYKD